MSYCTYWLGQGTGCLHFYWLPGQPRAASHWWPGGEWVEIYPHPPPVAERVNVKTLSLPIIWVTRGFGVCLRACACVCECVCWRKKRDKERESKGRERQAAFLLPPLASPSPCSLSLHPSSPLLDHPPALLLAKTETPLPPPRPPRDPLTLLTSPSHLWAGKTQLVLGF